MKKKIISMMLAIALATSLPTGIFAGEEAAPAEDGLVSEDFEDDPLELKAVLMSLGPISSEQSDHVEEALNEISKRKINATVDYTWFDAGTYATQVPMMLQAGEQLDLLMFTPIPSASYQSFMNQNQLTDITDILDEYGQGILKYMSDYLAATSRDGSVFGVGVLQDMSGSAAFDIRQDLLDELSLTEQAENATSFSEMKEIFRQVTDSSGINGMVNCDAQGTVMSPQPYMMGNSDFSEAEWVDTIGDSYNYVYVDPEDDQVHCYFENEKWQASVLMAHEWYEEGLIYKDAQTAQDYAGTLIKNDVGAGMCHAVEMSSKASLESSTGYPITEVSVAACKVSTASFTKFGMAVPVTTTDEDRAVALLNLIWDDEEYRNTLAWGVEGVDWIRKDDGTADYPEGVTSETVQYHTSDFLYSNRLETIPWTGDGAETIREEQKAANATLEISKYFGFAVDSTEVSNTITAVKDVVDAYYPSLCAGSTSDPERVMAEFVEKLYAAGMQELVDTYQAQLDEWLAQQ